MNHRNSNLFSMGHLLLFSVTRPHPGRRERGRGNGNTSLGIIRDSGFAGGKTVRRLIVNKYGDAYMTHQKVC